MVIRMTPVLYDCYENCCGCGACRQKCPRKAITMIENEYGFFVPKIMQDKCIGCGICIKTCPIINRDSSFLNKNYTPVAFAVRHKSKEILQRSSSGGAFTALVDVLQPDYVFGVLFTKNFKVVHACRNADDIDAFRGSKYVQSDTGNTFKETESLLQSGKVVLYTGTPCQIAGLKMYLGKEYENLYTCDLICEGVSSQQMFDKFLDNISIKRGEIRNISFRNKEKHGWERSDFVINFANGNSYRETCHTRDVFYMNNMMFLGGARHSCYNCKFDRLPRQGDFTIGDLWGWKEIIPQWKDNKGISLLTINSGKANEFYERLTNVCDIQQISIEQAAKRNPNLLKSSVAPEGREEYLMDLKSMSYVDLNKKYHRPRSKIRKILSRLKFIIFKG